MVHEGVEGVASSVAGSAEAAAKVRRVCVVFARAPGELAGERVG
ncbi:MAG: hypothetical protein RIQ79_1729, partial [Verrucomicrobiota bacterium]